MSDSNVRTPLQALGAPQAVGSLTLCSSSPCTDAEPLSRHVRTHTQERPYRCPFCNKAFSRSDNLAQYVSSPTTLFWGGGFLHQFDDDRGNATVLTCPLYQTPKNTRARGRRLGRAGTVQQRRGSGRRRAARASRRRLARPGHARPARVNGAPHINVVHDDERAGHPVGDARRTKSAREPALARGLAAADDIKRHDSPTLLSVLYVLFQVLLLLFLHLRRG